MKLRTLEMKVYSNDLELNLRQVMLKKSLYTGSLLGAFLGP